MARDASEKGRAVGRYVLHDEIAAGGMATVHVAKLAGAAGFSRAVAVKRLHPQFAKDPDFVAMFVDEARLASRIRHPNVVPVLDVVSTDGELFLVMEYVHGEPLSKLARAARANGGPVAPRIAVAIMIDVLEALEAAHETRSPDGSPLHLVHRDVSPQNVLVGDDGAARLLDFGIAKAVGRQQTTREGEVKGKSAYMSPEQVRGEEVDRRSDVFAAAIILWEILTGRRLFSTDHPLSTMALVLEMPIPPPSMHAPGLPKALDAVVLRGLERSRDARFASARAMSEALAKALTPASVGDVGEWCTKTSGPGLADRAALVARVESSPDIPFAPRPTYDSVALDDDTTPDTGPPVQVLQSGLIKKSTLRMPDAPLPVPAEPSAPASSLGPRRRVSIKLVVTAIVVVLCAVFAAWRVSLPRTVPAAPVASAIEPAPPLPAAPLVLDSSAVAALPAPAEPSASASGRPKPAIAKPRPANASGPGKPRVDGCSPPWTVDAQGVRIPKRECM